MVAFQNFIYKLKSKKYLGRHVIRKTTKKYKASASNIRTGKFLIFKAMSKVKMILNMFKLNFMILVRSVFKQVVMLIFDTALN